MPDPITAIAVGGALLQVWQTFELALSTKEHLEQVSEMNLWNDEERKTLCRELSDLLSAWKLALHRATLLLLRHGKGMFVVHSPALEAAIAQSKDYAERFQGVVGALTRGSNASVMEDAWKVARSATEKEQSLKMETSLFLQMCTATMAAECCLQRRSRCFWTATVSACIHACMLVW
uniref:Uncharacterized protein n=1 Tax=Chromera velia CCMP2878 TaxID=1169474 RepID=A0A0K6S696_9ALVE|eukprot:Cvel_2983.t2-p1 / transcript=Cvel_2983.t2 / gene=Cvel_2983 / organism=Chromera_velia_CCMP2878 / gene_product=hypothetical protein / transcript_product=hypothetical protein / location=Cvel_scaffold118:96975-97502(+) / protein_length=176 / sequence_SO=supercontig / SO=protein_coding / is_pseudo=false